MWRIASSRIHFKDKSFVQTNLVAIEVFLMDEK